MTDTTAKMLERVRALLAKAEDHSVTPQEAETFRAKADQLMTQYAIEQWMVDKAQSGVNQVAKPEVVYMDFGWYSTSKFRGDFWSMYQAVARHCRIVVGVRGYSYGKGMPVIGIKSDIEYFDMLFTHLLLTLGRQLEPSPETSGDLGAEVYKLRQAGSAWPRITEQIWRAGLVKLTAGERRKYPSVDDDTHFTNFPSALRNDIKNRLANANRAYVKANNLQGERNYVKPEVFQRSFAMGFVDEINDRLTKMRITNEDQYNAEHEAGSFALAIIDIRKQALMLYNEMWPAPEPVKDDGKKKKALVTREIRVDYGAMGKGRKAGAQADLQGHPGRRMGNQKELES